MTLPAFVQAILDVAQIATIIGLAIFGTWYAFFKEKKSAHAEIDADGDRLVNLLKGTVDELERRVLLLEESNTKLSKTLEDVKTENKSLRDVLQGRDAIQVEYQHRVLDTLLKLEEGNANALESIKSLYELMDKHVSLQERLALAQAQ